tara:strand:- start:427 stop:1218 length:792 start_codon:yes stop_codon:yes gene_type:complete
MSFDLDRYHALRTSLMIGARIQYRAITGSTMDDARELVEQGMNAEEGFACIADEQRNGRGRLGRQWVSAPGTGLYVTYYLRPKTVSNAPFITLAAALAVAGAVETISGAGTAFKWPNDVMHKGRKLSGILAESRNVGDHLDVFLGIGVNLRPNPNLPSELADIAISIEEITGEAPAIEDIAAELSNVLEARVEQVDRKPELILDDWRARLETLGQRVTVNTVTGSIDGIATDIGMRGELVIKLEDGSLQEVASGDVVRPADSG